MRSVFVGAVKGMLLKEARICWNARLFVSVLWLNCGQLAQQVMELETLIQGDFLNNPQSGQVAFYVVPV